MKEGNSVGMSDRIEAFILELMKQQQEDMLKIQRNELAQIFGCVPSQINYVISTRFNPDHGYITESRRGGGGYVMIKRVPADGNEVYARKELSPADANALVKQLNEAGTIDNVTAAVIGAALSDDALVSVENKNNVRADIYRNIMKVLM